MKREIFSVVTRYVSSHRTALTAGDGERRCSHGEMLNTVTGARLRTPNYSIKYHLLLLNPAVQKTTRTAQNQMDCNFKLILSAALKWLSLWADARWNFFVSIKRHVYILLIQQGISCISISGKWSEHYEWAGWAGDDVLQHVSVAALKKPTGSHLHQLQKLHVLDKCPQ